MLDRRGLWGLLMFLLASVVSAELRPEPSPILVLHSYHSTFEWVRGIQSGLEDGFESADVAIDMYVEHMDVKRLDAQFDPDVFSGYMRAKYSGVRPQLIVVSDGPALEFMLGPGQSIFPESDVLFAGISDGELAVYAIDVGANAGSPVVGGVRENIDIEATLELGAALWPDRTTVVVLTDATLVGQGNRAVIRSIEQRFQGQLDFRYLTPATQDELERAVSRLGDEEILLYNHFVYTESDGYLPFEWIIPEIASLSPVPMLATHDFMIAYGASAGFVTDGYKQGMTVSMQAVRLLSGAPLLQVAESPNSVVVNEPELLRYEARMASLPTDAVVLYRMPGFIESNPWVVGVSAVTIGLLATIVALLLIQSNLRKRSLMRINALNSQLAVAVQEKSVLIQEVHHRTKNNLQVLESMIGLQLAAGGQDSSRGGLEPLSNRIRAISLVHQQLYRTESLSSVGLAEYIGSLIGQIQELHAPGTSHDDDLTRIKFDEPNDEIVVGMDIAVPVGLIVNECITNSLQHAQAPPPRRLVVGVSLFGVQDGRLELVVRDNGPGFPDGLKRTEGLGMQLVQGLAEQIGGSASFDNRGGAVTAITWRQAESQ